MIHRRLSDRIFPVCVGLVVALGTLSLGSLGGAPPDNATAQPPKLPDTNLAGLTYQPLPKTVPFESKETVQKWIDENDTKSMTLHAWQVWGGLTEWVTQDVGGSKLRVALFETWFDPPQVFAPPAMMAARQPQPGVRPFTRPRQLSHRQGGQSQLPRSPAEEALAPADPIGFRAVTVKYNREIRDSAQSNRFYDGTALQKINDGWGSTPIADRNLKPYPDTAVMLKPVFQFISGTEATLLPYWAGPDKRADQSKPPGPTNWSEKMLVIPPGVAKIGVRGVPTVSLDRFYSSKLTAAEADSANKNLGPFNPPLKAGDYSILVGMHVSTREIDNWTWQTYWWSLTPPAIPAAIKSRIQPPFDNYEVQVGYSFMTGPASGAAATNGNPNSLPLVCFNPYLEGGFGNSTFEPISSNGWRAAGRHFCNRSSGTSCATTNARAAHNLLPGAFEQDGRKIAYAARHPTYPTIAPDLRLPQALCPRAWVEQARRQPYGCCGWASV